MNFKNKAEKNTAKEILRAGQKDKFWKLIVSALEESKETIQKKQDSADMKDLPADLYKLENELCKAKKEFINNLIKTPDNIISWLEDPQSDNRDFDPYDK